MSLTIFINKQIDFSGADTVDLFQRIFLSHKMLEERFLDEESKKSRSSIQYEGYTKGSMTGLPRTLFQNKHVVERAVQDNGVFTSGEIIQRVIEVTGLSPNAAAKSVERACSNSEIWRSEKLVLARNWRLFAKARFTESPAFLPVVIAKLTHFRAGMARCLIALQHREILLVADAARLLASPIDAVKQKTYPSLEDELAGLLELPFLRREGKDTPADRLCLNTLTDTRKEQALARRAIVRKNLEDKLTDVVQYQFAIQNIITWGAVGGNLRRDFNNYPFSGNAHSRLQPLRRPKKNDPKTMTTTPIVFDVYSGTIAKETVEGFLERIARAGYNSRVKLPILGVIAAQDFYPDAWNTARNAGLVSINLGQMFGREGLEVLVMAEKILSQIPSEQSVVQTTEFETLTKLVYELKTNPFFSEFRGLAFATAVSFILAGDNWQNVAMGVVSSAEVKGEVRERETDVSGTRRDGEELMLVECKAEVAEKELDAAYVRKFFTETIHVYLKEHPEREIIKTVYAEIWTTGRIGDEAREAFEEIKFKSYIKPKLRSLEDITANIRHKQRPIKRLLAVISGRGLIEDLPTEPIR